jgi:signal peptidase II
MASQPRFKVFDFSMSDTANRNYALRKYFFLIAALVVLLDRISKWAVAASLPLHAKLTVIPGFFDINHVQNTGAAFGLFAESTAHWKVAALVTFSLIALIIVTILLWKNSHTVSTMTVGLSLILGGAFGNLWDRVVDGHVVDFLDFHIGTYSWPAFNVADSAIVVGAILLVAEILFAKPSSEVVKSSS